MRVSSASITEAEESRAGDWDWAYPNRRRTDGLAFPAKNYSNGFWWGTPCAGPSCPYFVAFEYLFERVQVKRMTRTMKSMPQIPDLCVRRTRRVAGDLRALFNPCTLCWGKARVRAKLESGENSLFAYCSFVQLR